MKIFNVFFISALCCIISGCNKSKSIGVDSVCTESICIDDVVVENSSNSLVDDFFRDFQETDSTWVKTFEGHQRLVNAFNKKMISDIDFAKACASYKMDNQYAENPIEICESIAPYSTGDGEEGELKAFDIVITIPLKKPLYNGQKTVEVSYEIVCPIPSTVEEHCKPYVNNVNYCTESTPYFNFTRDGVLNLGSYLIGHKN